MSDQKPSQKDLKEQADALLREAAAQDRAAAKQAAADEDSFDFEDETLESLDEADAAALVIEQMEAENKELKDKSLRLMAEMENLRRRTEREVRDSSKYAIAKFAGDILSVSDNLTRALQAISDEAKAEADSSLKGLIEGVEMTERDLQSKLEKHGVTQLNPEGEKFDPNLHQAMFEVPNPDVPNGTVVQVVQAGFVIADRVLRPAMVGVARGGPKVAPAPAEPADSEPGETLDKSV